VVGFRISLVTNDRDRGQGELSSPQFSKAITPQMTTPIETAAPLPRKKPMPVNPQSDNRRQNTSSSRFQCFFFLAPLPSQPRREAITVTRGALAVSPSPQGEEMLKKVSPEKVETDKEDRGEAVNITSKAALRLTR